MKLKDVPQDKDPSYEGATKLCYAIDDNGRFVKASTNGWAVEETVKSLAWQAIEKDLESTRGQVRTGKTSALAYFMKVRQMDVKLLSQNMETSYLRTWWHLRPNTFKKLSPAWIQKYSDCLDIPVETLRSYKGEFAYSNQ